MLPHRQILLPSPCAWVLVLAIGFFNTASFAADIYVSVDADGVSHYASAPIDSSYQLLLRGESKPATPLPPAKYSQQRSQQRAQFLAIWLPQLRQMAHKHQVDANLVLAVIEVESRYQPQALSPKGAQGLMQLMPAVAQRYGAHNPHDIAQNLEAGIAYLGHLQKVHKDNLALVLAAYNAGAGAVARHGQRIPPYKETMLYVPQVLAQLARLREQGAQGALASSPLYNHAQDFACLEPC